MQSNESAQAVTRVIASILCAGGLFLAHYLWPTILDTQLSEITVRQFLQAALSAFVILTTLYITAQLWRD